MKLGQSAGTQRGEGRPEEEKNPELQTSGRGQRGRGAGGGGQESEAPGGPQQELSLVERVKPMYSANGPHSSDLELM